MARYNKNYTNLFNLTCKLIIISNKLKGTLKFCKRANTFIILYRKNQLCLTLLNCKETDLS
jgi:hypothetical protein